MLRKYRVVPYVSNMISEVDQFINKLKLAYGENKINYNMFDDYSRLTLNIIGFIAFDHEFQFLNEIGADSNKYKNEDNTNNINNNDSLGIATRYLAESHTTAMLTPLPPVLTKLMLRYNSKYQKALKIVHSYVDNIIEGYRQKKLAELKANNNIENKTNSTRNNDEIKGDDESIPAVKQNLLNLLMCNLQLDEAGEARKPENERFGLTKGELIDNITLLIFGGYETTSTALSWFTHFIAKQPEIQQKMKQQINKYISRDQPLTVDVLSKLEYVDCVIKEVFRLSPMILGTGRTALNDDIIGETKVKAGDLVSVPVHSLHTDRRYWKLDPLKFIPERFYGPHAPDRNHHSFAYLPFGGGNHACAGQDLARLEFKTLVTRLMQFLTFIDTPENSEGQVARITVIPKHLAVKYKFD